MAKNDVEQICSGMIEKSTRELFGITKELSEKISEGNQSGEKLAGSVRENRREVEKLSKAVKWTKMEQVRREDREF